MNIVILNDFAYVDGGASKIALGSAKALAKRGHRVLLFTAVGPIDPTLLDVDGLTVVCLDQYEIVADPNRLRAAVTGFWNHNAAIRLAKYLIELDPVETVLHLHSWPKALSASVVRKATDLGFKVLITLHDFFSVCPTGGFFIHPTRQICHLRPMSAACVRTQCDSRSYGHKLWRVGRQWMQSHPGHLPSAVHDFISISSLSEDVMRPLLPQDARLHRVSNFIEVERGRPAEVDQYSVFSFVGRLSPEKGPALLAECARRLNLDIQFVGDGPSREELGTRAPNATFTGWVSPAQTQDAMRASRALVFPSLWYETQGLVVAEAAALGVPAIVPSTSAAREWVEDGVTGLVFRGGDSNDLAEKISLLRDDPKMASALGQEAYRRYWKAPATLDGHCKGLEETYRKMLALSTVNNSNEAVH